MIRTRDFMFPLFLLPRPFPILLILDRREQVNVQDFGRVRGSEVDIY